MSAKIIQSSIPTKGDVPVQAVLDGAAHAGLRQVLLLGRMPNGQLYPASSMGDVGDMLLLVEEWKHKLLSGDYA